MCYSVSPQDTRPSYLKDNALVIPTFSYLMAFIDKGTLSIFKDFKELLLYIALLRETMKSLNLGV